MTREDAEREAERLGREHPERDSHRWFARRGDAGDWHVVKVAAAGLGHPPMKATVEAKPRPPQADDPRSNVARDAPYGGA